MPARAIQLFVTCLVDAFRPAVGLAAVQVLERLGCEVVLPAGQTCCGQPAFNAGALADARAMARHTLDVLHESPHPVVVPSGSCADMIAHHYPTLFAEDGAQLQRVRQLAKRTHEFSQFLCDELGVDDLGARGRGRVAYHASCHLLRGLGVREGPERLLAAVDGIERCALDGAEECCGFGGLFSVKMADVSSAMLTRKLDRIAAAEADTVVTCDTGCLLHLQGGLDRRGLPVRVCHLAEVLAGR